MKNVAVVLYGAGYKDGSEITESVSALIALSELKVNVHHFSFDEDFKAADADEMRNALKESQRISRNRSRPMRELSARDFEAVVIPGGSGLLKNLTTFEQEKEKFSVNAEFARVITEFHAASKPIGAICIAPFLVARILQKYNPLVTLGETSDKIEILKKLKIQHEKCPSSDFITDRDCKIISTPAYMNAAPEPFEVYTGIRLMIKELVEMA